MLYNPYLSYISPSRRSSLLVATCRRLLVGRHCSSLLVAASSSPLVAAPRHSLLPHYHSSPPLRRASPPLITPCHLLVAHYCLYFLAWIM
ncbi:hypothetical protein ACOSQ3_013602 [Xanthoceras sorbifolium]